jgi:hypothetical protein
MIRRFPACEPVVQFLRYRNGNDTVEDVLESLRREAEAYPRAHRQLAAIRWYLRCMLTNCLVEWAVVCREITNQRTLLGRIDRYRSSREPVMFVTFNYDCMIEDALSSFGVDLRSPSNLSLYISDARYKLVKLHGSINWSREITHPSFTTTLTPDQPADIRKMIDNAADLMVNDNFFVTQDPFQTRTPSGRAIFPAIAIPVRQKDIFECPREHVETLLAAIPSVSKLLIIGWRANDEAFLEMLRDRLATDPQILVVAGGLVDARATIQRLCDAQIRGAQNAAAFEGIFTDFVRLRAMDEFLNT